MAVEPFQINPSICEVAYTCASVTRADGEASDISCTDFTVNTAGGVTSFRITADAATKYETLQWEPADYIVTI